MELQVPGAGSLKHLTSMQESGSSSHANYNEPARKKENVEFTVF
jgi:hypothetical protein